MNRYRVAWAVMSLWWLWLLLALVGATGLCIGWSAALKAFVFFAVVVTIAVTIAVYGEVMSWLDDKAREHGRRTSHEEGTS